MNIDFNNVILKKYDIDRSDSTSVKKMNIAYGVDRNFLFGSGISMTSVLVNNRDIAIHFFVFTDFVDNDYIDCVTRLAETYRTTITILVFDNQAFRQLPSTKFWSYAMYYRYVAFEYLSKDSESVLYLDADVICKGPLRELTQIDFNGEYAAVVNDIDDVRLKSGDRLGIPKLTETYFNSGVVFANLVVWKEQKLLTKAFGILLDKNKELLYFDQDVLNILFVGNVILLRRDFNCIYGVDWILSYEQYQEYILDKHYLTDETRLVHYVGVTKPWHGWANYPVSKYFIKAYKKSAWSDKPLLNANTAKLFKRKSRHERLQKKYFRSLISHIMYIKAKLGS
ncbi:MULTISPECIES: glycosyltransferase family 8 protein [Tenebrionibacter/Tenebrionicola group]|jgi:UDP-glucose/galactose:(glucosyl)LPS alpha-1,2-glucosyl/galactosyltransferase|uniref:Lipopolysaccharide 1,2-glucosyltransferase n=2 Tax=Tenebrionibacter/Tenebrionicola group TaxID=2969848 RepID=A0A8K0XWD0_9ENTR|nr:MULTISPECIES: glycosyltransferase [Tenebrionibacter/Tenebrionicola group]MBK4714378.1 lipopolysaccharide 1,2-glucosyltransferase [Tenebrionibacter intestinalis]MBV5095215.1 lipopolysaccharide 1,2-glucosyltransferase [Tenebrionicola larvae]